MPSSASNKRGDFTSSRRRRGGVWDFVSLWESAPRIVESWDFMLVFFEFCFFAFFFNDTATTEIYTLSLHDALPISGDQGPAAGGVDPGIAGLPGDSWRSEEHTSELQSLRHLVCRLLLEKKKKK